MMNNNQNPNSRPTIGFLTSTPGGTYEENIYHGVADAAKERGANLICFASASLGVEAEFVDVRNAIYELAATQRIHGLVILSGVLGRDVSLDAFTEFCGRYRPLPIVSIGLALEGIPSVLLNNEQGLREVITHLAQIHGYRRIAFIRGPEGHQEADERYRVYTQVLAEHGLPFDPDLVAPGDFLSPSGTEAIRLLLDQRGVAFEAVAAANDNMAIAAMEELQARGLHVPGDVAVVGFDDIDAARISAPELTTVRQPRYAQGRWAVDLVLDMLAGAQVPEQTRHPSELVIRQSCGCADPEIVYAAAGPVARQDEPFAIAFAARREDILSAVAQPLAGVVAEQDVERVLDAFAAELAGDPSAAFLPTLETVLGQEVAGVGDLRTWQGALSSLRRQALPFLGDARALARAEDLWHQARVMIGKAMERTWAHHESHTQGQSYTLHEVGEALTAAFDLEELVAVAMEELPRLGIPSCYLSLYEGQALPAENSWLTLAYDENGQVELGTDRRRFRSRQLVPDGTLPQDRRYTLVVEPLYVKKDQIGFALFEVGPRKGRVYDTLGGQLSSALKAALLLEERKRAEEALEKAYAEVERQVEERTAELQRETSERERLQEEIIDAQKRALQELSTPIIPVMDRIIVMPLIGSIDTMRARDITRSLLAGIGEHRAQVVILDITGVPIVDSGVADHLNKTIQAARLKGARTIVTGISDAVAETIIDLGIDWSSVDTMADLRTGLVAALESLGIRLTR